MKRPRPYYGQLALELRKKQEGKSRGVTVNRTVMCMAPITFGSNYEYVDRVHECLSLKSGERVTECNAVSSLFDKRVVVEATITRSVSSPKPIPPYRR